MNFALAWTYMLIDSTGARAHLSREQVAEVLRVWETPPRPFHDVFGRFEGCHLLVSGPCNGEMLVSVPSHEAWGWVKVKRGDVDCMRAWLADKSV